MFVTQNTAKNDALNILHMRDRPQSILWRPLFDSTESDWSAIYAELADN